MRVFIIIKLMDAFSIIFPNNSCFILCSTEIYVLLFIWFHFMNKAEVVDPMKELKLNIRSSHLWNRNQNNGNYVLSYEINQRIIHTQEPQNFKFRNHFHAVNHKKGVFFCSLFRFVDIRESNRFDWKRLRPSFENYFY